MKKFVMSALAVAVATAGMLAVTVPQADAAGGRIDHWADGDSLTLTNGEEVRLIGVNTPEWNRCGGRAAKRLANRLAPPGSRVRLVNPRSVREYDKWGRHLRYVVVDGVDVGLRQIRAGAKARYDGRDGYDYHPRQGRYHRVDSRTRDYCSRRSGSTTRSYAPVGYGSGCPTFAPIKGNRPSMIYHMRGQAYYSITSPEECFATPQAAERHGYRAALI